MKNSLQYAIILQAILEIANLLKDIGINNIDTENKNEFLINYEKLLNKCKNLNIDICNPILIEGSDIINENIQYNDIIPYLKNIFLLSRDLKNINNIDSFIFKLHISIFDDWIDNLHICTCVKILKNINTYLISILKLHNKRINNILERNSNVLLFNDMFFNNKFFNENADV